MHGGFGLYVHWPFCAAKCPYCDFNSHVTRSVDHDRWQSTFLGELRRVRDEIGPRVLNSIFFGGGTPSLMEPLVVAAVIEAACTHWTPANDIEITLEANPGSVERGRFQAFAEGGVNRVSMGIQALNDADLRRLGRLHSREDALRAFDVARDVFARVSFDLIYARQDQSVQAWESELRQALSYAVDHLSLYQLTIEPGTAFGERHAAGRLHGLPDEDLGADMFEVTQRVCAEAGFPAYEVSNHARLGAESRHNLIYWTCGDYVGIGPGAHGRVTRDGRRLATESYLAPDTWLSAAEAGSGYKCQTALSAGEQAQELLLMGLRRYDGVDLRRYEQVSGEALSGDVVSDLIKRGLVAREHHMLRATAEGMPLLNYILRQLLDD